MTAYSAAFVGNTNKASAASTSLPESQVGGSIETTSQKSASLTDFRNFHGMLCSHSTASRCIKSFDGTILFMPSTYTESTLSSFDRSTPGLLNLATYYLLVLLSFTGLSTLLRMTDFRESKEFPFFVNNTNNKKDNSDDHQQQATKSTLTKSSMNCANPASLASEYNSVLRVEDFVLDFCKNYTHAHAIYLKRYFEFKFRLVGLEVIMLHFVCDQNKLHLVEVYHFDNWFGQNYLSPFFTSFANLYKKYFVASECEPAKKES